MRIIKVSEDCLDNNYYYQCFEDERYIVENFIANCIEILLIIINISYVNICSNYIAVSDNKNLPALCLNRI